VADISYLWDNLSFVKSCYTETGKRRLGKGGRAFHPLLSVHICLYNSPIPLTFGEDR
jgi:hypothetical protein